MFIHLVVNKSAQNDSIIYEIGGSLYVALEDAPEISL